MLLRIHILCLEHFISAVSRGKSPTLVLPAVLLALRHMCLGCTRQLSVAAVGSIVGSGVVVRPTGPGSAER